MLKMSRLGRLSKQLAIALALGCCVGSHLVHAQQTWSMATAYPRDTIAGQGVASFASELNAKTAGDIVIEPQFKAKAGGKDLVSDVQSGRLQLADVFTGSLSRIDPIFDLPTIPFQVKSLAQAQRLTLALTPLYRRALLRAGLHMLFISPWPPTGLWSRRAITVEADLSGMRVRTYDASSAQVLTDLGMQASDMPVLEVSALLGRGELDGVLSSGDGAVGRSFAGKLPNFTAIHYAFPVSFVVMSQSAYEALPLKQKHQVDVAAEEVQRRQWAALPARIEQNYTAMRSSGIRVNTDIGDALQAYLRDAGDARMQQWLSHVPTEYSQIVRSVL